MITLKMELSDQADLWCASGVVRLGRFMERSGVLPTIQFLIGKIWVPLMPLLCLSHMLQNALESGQETRIVQSDLREGFDSVG